MQFRQFWRRLFGPRSENLYSAPVTVSDNDSNSQNRALVWLGKDRLERQYFYENWACHETWQVHEEGIPLLLGRDPGDSALAEDTDFVQQREELWEHLQRCVQRQVSPQLINPAEDPSLWRAGPVELYRWAVAARIEVPEELDSLLSFISMTVKPETVTGSDYAETANESMENSQLLAREQILSVMLSLCIQAYHRSSNEGPESIRSYILENIYAKSEQFFDQSEPPLSRPALHDLIDRSLEMAGMIHLSE